ncbi:MAG: hypothetical protein O3B42_08475 [Actinomycetota bacterium]|nr:hypothetical protein [Actinomycetota bacterium]
MTKRTVIVAAWALALTAACSASPAVVDPSDTAPLTELSATTDSQSTGGISVLTGDAPVSGDETLPIGAEGSGSEGSGSESLESEASDTDTTDGAEPEPTNDPIEGLDDLDDLLGDLDDLLAGLDDEIDDLEDSFDENEGDIEE